MATKAMLSLLTGDERRLIEQTTPKRLGKVNEDQLITLLDRIRRARNKYSKLHRRQSSAQVKADAARGFAAKKNERTASKAEIFEEALSRVSRQLSVESRRSAKDLRASRIADAKKAKASPRKKSGKASSGKAKRRSGSGSASKHRAQHLKSAGRLKKNASVKSKGKRRQAKRDSR